MNEPKKPRGLDPELQAMARIDRILSELPISCIPRILAWISGRWELVELGPNLSDPRD